jgi:CheY-like chemotaxis protein
MYVPRALDDPSVDLERIHATASIAGGIETILVVEDNEAIRRTAVAQLSSLGYRVLEAVHGEAALHLLERHASEVALVFSDVVMPGHPNGHELTEIIEHRFPAIRVLLTSGFPGDSWGRTESGTLRRTLLNKPYRMAELARLVRHMLDAPSTRGAVESE